MTVMTKNDRELARAQQQRDEALERANEVRLQRALYKKSLKTNPERLIGLLELGSDAPEWPYVKSAPLGELLAPLPQVGKVVIRRICADAGVTEAKKMEALTARQRGLLVQAARRHSTRLRDDRFAMAA